MSRPNKEGPAKPNWASDMARYKYIPKQRRVHVRAEEIIDDGDDPATWWDEKGRYVPAERLQSKNAGLAKKRKFRE